MIMPELVRRQGVAFRVRFALNEETDPRRQKHVNFVIWNLPNGIGLTTGVPGLEGDEVMEFVKAVIQVKYLFETGRLEAMAEPLPPQPNVHIAEPAVLRHWDVGVERIYAAIQVNEAAVNSGDVFTFTAPVRLGP